MHLIMRNSKNKQIKNGRIEGDFHNGIPKILLNELLHCCPVVVAPSNSYASPIIHMIFNVCYKPKLFTQLTLHQMRYGIQFMKMIVKSDCDLNATDNLGNTFLHVVVSDVVQEINFFDSFYNEHITTTLINNAVDTVEVLLENGSYLHAKNKKGKCPYALLQDIKVRNRNKEYILIPFSYLFKKFESILSLKYLAARKIADSHIPYTNKLPKALARFVDLH